jgi:hypothetical protein
MLIDCIYKTKCWRSPAQLDQKWKYTYKFAQSIDGLGSVIRIFEYQDELLVCWDERPQANHTKYITVGSVNNGESWSRKKWKYRPDTYLLDSKENAIIKDHCTISLDKRTLLVKLVLYEEDKPESSLKKKDSIDINISLNSPDKSINKKLTMFLYSYSFHRARQSLYVPYLINTRSRIKFGRGFNNKFGPSVMGYVKSSFASGSSEVEKSIILPYSASGLNPVLINNELHFFWQHSGSIYKSILYYMSADLKTNTFNKQIKLSDSAVIDSLRVIPEKDELHACWADSRDEDKYPDHIFRFWRYYPRFTPPYRNNQQIIYRKKNAAGNWGNEVMLSSKQLYAFSPALAVSRDIVVAVWAGVDTPTSMYHYEHNPNDIYYSISYNSGVKWSSPMRITDNLAKGMTAGRPRVLIKDGKIHVLYIQGHFALAKSNFRLLNLPPWEVVYCSRNISNLKNSK